MADRSRSWVVSRRRMPMWRRVEGEGGMVGLGIWDIWKNGRLIWGLMPAGRVFIALCWTGQMLPFAPDGS